MAVGSDLEAGLLNVPPATVASYPVRPGNSLRLLVDGEPAFRRLCEAIETAQHSVWATVTFMWAAFRMPDGRGAALDVLGRAAARGVDVRIIFWRPDEATESLKTNAFWGSAEHMDLLEASGSTVRIRWDRAEPGYCQHQKSWLIDAGTAGETTFLGGINLNPHSMVVPGHGGEGQNHDAYVELAGPSAVDVHHNFVQRWNEASERHLPGGRWGLGSEVDLPFPTEVPPRRGDAAVQIQRTIHRGRHSNEQATPGGVPFDIAAGEQSNYEQYLAAIRAARSSIYIENQYVAVLPIVESLREALRRGVEVVMLIPAEADRFARYVGEDQPGFFESWMALSGYENCTLAGIAGVGADGQRKLVYVHAKLMLVDDAWATIGSCNLHRFSLFGNGEMNAAIWSPDVVRSLRCELLQEHLDLDTSGMDDRTALQTFRNVAQQNGKRYKAGDHNWQGLAFALSSATYGQ